MRSNAATPSDLEAVKQFALSQSDDFAWPTFWLGIGTIVTIISATLLGLYQLIPLWLAGVINFCGFCAGYTVGHEVIHNNLIGHRRDLSWLNTFFGTLFFSVPFHSYSMHRFIHLRHHAYTNHPVKDPDMWINGRNIFELCLKLATHYPHYTYFAFKATRGVANRRTFLVKSMLEQLIPIIIACAFMFSGFAMETILLWIIPSILVYPTLALILDWIPHHDLGEGTPFDTSRVVGAPQGVMGKLFNWLYLYQNYHLIHHLYPRVPFYRYEQIYETCEPPLRAAGAKIYSAFDKKRTH